MTVNYACVFCEIGFLNIEKWIINVKHPSLEVHKISLMKNNNIILMLPIYIVFSSSFVINFSFVTLEIFLLFHNPGVIVLETALFLEIILVESVKMIRFPQNFFPLVFGMCIYLNPLQFVKIIKSAYQPQTVILEFPLGCLNATVRVF